MTKRTQRDAMLAAIARREWLLQMLALGAAACRRGDQAYTRGNTLVIAIRDVKELEYDDFDIQAVYLPRLAEADENGDLQPLLAQSWEHTDDYRECIYHLRTGVRWSDGVPVTAHDVKFTLDLLNHPAVHYEVVDAVTVLDDYVVKIERRAGAGPDRLGWIYYLPKHVLEDLDPKKFWEWDFWRHPAVSAGPYRFVRYVPETMIEFEANPSYFRGKPKIERLIYKFVEEAGLVELLSGNVDIVTWPIADPAQAPSIAKDPRFLVLQDVTPGAMAIYWKCDHPLFRDARVRRALTLAMDRRALLGVLNLPSDVPITDGVFTERQLLRHQLPEPLPYDPAQARALLEAAGWQDHDGDGVRERGGRPFHFTAIVRGTVGYDRLAVYVQALLRQVGVQMEVQVLDPSVVWSRLDAGDFEAVFMLHQSPPFAQRKYFGRDNPLGYGNSEMVRLTDQVVATADPDERDRIYRALAEILRADLPVTRLVPSTRTTFAHRRVRAPSTSLLAMPDRYMESLWLENER